MRVIVDFCLIPIGVGVSLSPYVALCQKVLDKSNLNFELNSFSTTIEGEWDEVFGAIRECHELIHEKGAPRIVTNIKIGSRIDKDETINSKIESVVSLLNKEDEEGI